MLETKKYHIHKIQQELANRQRHNPQYSLRAFARDIGVHPATLSQVMKGNRPLPLKTSHVVVEKLALAPKERTLFLESLYRSKTTIDDIKIDENDDRFMLDESYFNVIAQWEHYAVLTLFDIDSFDCSVQEVARRLGISELRADVVLENLKVSGLLSFEDGQYRKSQSRVRTTEDISSLALKESHKETLEMGKVKLDEVEVMLRDFSAMTVAVDLEKLTEAKTIIREFRQKMMALLRDGNKTDVYQLAIQFYPLTKTEKLMEM